MEKELRKRRRVLDYARAGIVRTRLEKMRRLQPKSSLVGNPGIEGAIEVAVPIGFQTERGDKACWIEERPEARTGLNIQRSGHQRRLFLEGVTHESPARAMVAQGSAKGLGDALVKRDPNRPPEVIMTVGRSRRRRRQEHRKKKSDGVERALTGKETL